MYSAMRLGDVLLDAVVEVELHLEHRGAHHRGHVRVAALLTAAGLEVSLGIFLHLTEISYIVYLIYLFHLLYSVYVHYSI